MSKSQPSWFGHTVYALCHRVRNGLYIRSVPLSTGPSNTHMFYSESISRSRGHQLGSSDRITAWPGSFAYAAMTESFGRAPEPVRIRMMGGTVPTAEIVEALRVPFAIVPLVNADNNQHAANENMRMGNYVDGIRTIYGLLTSPLR